MTHRKIGVLLVNLGTPDSPAKKDVRRYLREFLSDARVIDIPWLVRRALVECIILPFRTKKSAANYQKIWLPQGSPLRIYSESLKTNLQSTLGDKFSVKLAMRYGNPSVDLALQQFNSEQIDQIICVPLFPQYSGAAWASAAAHVYVRAANSTSTPTIAMMPSFFNASWFIESWVENLSLALAQNPKAHVIFSYHGLPVRQIHRQDSLGQCQLNAHCCANPKIYCYRSQCFATSRRIADRLGIKSAQWTTAFQSRFSGDKWLGPDTDREMVRLAVESPEGIIVASPSFVVDCLETIEELGMRGREEFETAGGRNFALVPCLQNSETFVQGLSQWILTKC